MSVADSRGPLPVTRRAELLKALQDQGTVRVSDLTERLGVAPVTIRRDIAELAAAGLVQRVHGGATLIESDTEQLKQLEDDAQRQLADDVVAPTGERDQTSQQLTGTVGMMVPSLDYYWPEVARGAETQAHSRGLSFVLRSSSYETDEDRTQLLRLVEGLQVSGLVLAPRLDVPSAQETLEWLAGIGLPVVLVERTANVGPHHAVAESVVTDFPLGAVMAVRHLISLGHEKVGLLTSAHSPNSPHVRRGWLEAAVELGLDLAATTDREIDNPRTAEGTAVLDAVLDECLDTGTTALLVHADPEAIALVQRCEQRHLSVPGDLSIVAYDDEVAGLFSPRLSAVRTPRNSLGRAAVDLVAARLLDPGRPAHRIVISPTLRVRQTSGPPHSR